MRVSGPKNGVHYRNPVESNWTAPLWAMAACLTRETVMVYDKVTAIRIGTARRERKSRYDKHLITLACCKVALSK
jgi:hypothetical protein